MLKGLQEPSLTVDIWHEAREPEMGALARVVGVVGGQGDVLAALQEEGACHRQQVQHACRTGTVVVVGMVGSNRSGG